jgi:hypothetical protein
LTDSDNKETAFEFIDNLKEIEKVVIDTDMIEHNNAINNIVKKSGRKTKDKIEIPIPPKRNKEKWTILSKNDTIKLFDYLIQLECLINDTKKVSKDSIAKAIYAITGYSDNDTAEEFFFDRKKSITLKEKKVLIENLKDLIVRNL